MNPRGETRQHLDLKRRALIWAQAHGFAICATEVRIPRSAFRADLAACISPDPRTGAAGETAIFECKQARADLLRDSADERTVVRRLAELGDRRRELERLLGAHLPDLRRGESLFAECDSCDFESIRHDGLRAVRREEATLRGRLYAGTKFSRLRRFRSADRLYLVVTAGILRPHEVPDGWGLLQAGDAGLELARAPEHLAAGVAARLALLDAVARAATRQVNERLAVTRAEVEDCRRDVIA